MTSEPRLKRSVRFSDREWSAIERAAEERSRAFDRNVTASDVIRDSVISILGIPKSEDAPPAPQT